MYNTAVVICVVCLYVFQSVLAAIIWVALYGMFKQTKDVWKYFKLSVWDMVSGCVRVRCVCVPVCPLPPPPPPGLCGWWCSPPILTHAPPPPLPSLCGWWCSPPILTHAPQFVWLVVFTSNTNTCPPPPPPPPPVCVAGGVHLQY